MDLKVRAWIACVGIAGMLATSAMAGAVADSKPAGEADQVRQLQQEVQMLRDEVRQLRGDKEASWLDERRAEEVKTLVKEVLADADTRASLLENGMTAGHNGKKFFLASADGGFLMQIVGQIQLRYVANFRNNNTARDIDDEGEAGFQIRRTKLEFSGHIASPRIKYAVQLAVSADDNDVYADKITVGYDLTDQLSIWAGEDKAPFLREEMISSKRQLAVERSLINEAFTLDKVQGVCMAYKTDQLRIMAMVHDGRKSGDGSGSKFWSDWDTPKADSKDFHEDRTDFAVVARVDAVLMGSYKQWKQYTSFPGDEQFLTVGGAIDYEVAETGDDSDNTKVLAWTIDAEYAVNGLSIAAWYAGASFDYESDALDDRAPWGLVAQVAYNMPIGPGSLEPFVRYEYLDADTQNKDEVGQQGPDDDSITLLTFGANYYLTKHNAKFTLDVVWAMDMLDEDGFPGVSSSLGLLHDAVDEDDQVAVRAQFQLVF